VRTIGVVGIGIPQLIFIRLLPGWFLAKIQNACAIRMHKFLWLVFYIWFCLINFIAFSWSTFYWLTRLVCNYVPYTTARALLHKLFHDGQRLPIQSNTANARKVGP